MRLLHVSPSFAPAYRYGGPVRSLEGLLPALVRAGAEVHVLTTDVDGPGRLDVPSEVVSRDGVAVRYCHSWTDRDFAPSMARLGPAELRWADVVHVTGLFSATSVWGMISAEHAGRPLVVSPRGQLERGSLDQRSARKRIALRLLEPPLLRVTRFHATSEKERASIRAVLPSATTLVVPNGAPLPDVDPTSILSTAPRVLALGRVHPSKGYVELVRAIALLFHAGLGCELEIAGPIEDAAYAARIESTAAELGVRDRVRLLGPLDGQAKTDFLVRGRVLALPSFDTENFGNVVIEALAARRPVVASAHAPWASLETESCGRHVPNTPAALAAALEPYLRDASLAGEAGARGRALVEREYAWPTIAQRALAMYEDAMRATRR